MTFPTESELTALAEKCARATQSKRFTERVDFDDGLCAYEIQNDEMLVAFYEHNYEEPIKAKFDAELFAAANPQTVAQLVRMARGMIVMRNGIDECIREYINPRAECADKTTSMCAKIAAEKLNAKLARADEILGGRA